MLFTSTRKKLSITPSMAIINGISEDGGLYVPECFPRFDIALSKLADMNYAELAIEILGLYLTDFTCEELAYCVNSAYNANPAKFDTPDTVPLVKHGEYYLELFHGRTLAFKDMALSILPYLMKVSMNKNGIDRELVILTATSGDTGIAALDGFTGVEGTRIIVFYPESGVSEIQKLQMTTHLGENTHVVGIKGNFDDAQTGVKKIFDDKVFADELASKGIALSSANSINIGRLLPQVVYYFYAYGQLVKSGAINAGDQINYTVPTGNFGNILAGYYAARMGLPVSKLICASNENKVLYDFFNNGEYDINRKFLLTLSPSMDILISSNLERLLYHLRDGNTVEDKMLELKTNGKYIFNERSDVFAAEYADDSETLAAIKRVYTEHAYVIDTHTAVAAAAYEKYTRKNQVDTVNIILSTASPYKFGGSVYRAITGNDSGEMGADDLLERCSKLIGIPVPERLRGIGKKKIMHNNVCDKDGMKQVFSGILGI